MPTVDDLKKSKYLKKEDFPVPKLAIITGYDQVNMAKSGEKADMKYVLNFQGIDKPLTLNKTNGNAIAAITGSKDFDDWIGAKVVLFNDPGVEMGGELVGGIRIRPPKTTTPATTAKPAIPQARGFNPNGTRLPANFNPNTDMPDDEPPAREPEQGEGGNDLPF